MSICEERRVLTSSSCLMRIQSFSLASEPTSRFEQTLVHLWGLWTHVAWLMCKCDDEMGCGVIRGDYRSTKALWHERKVKPLLTLRLGRPHAWRPKTRERKLEDDKSVFKYFECASGDSPCPSGQREVVFVL